MTERKEMALFLSGVGMELCWLYAWAAFLLFSICGQYFSFFFLIILFAWGFAASSFHRDRGWRRIQVLIFRVFLFAGGFLVVFQAHLSASFHVSGFFNQIAWLRGPWEVFQWLFFLLLLFFACVIWQRSSALAFHPLRTENVYNRFDFGIAAFFTLLIIKLLFAVKGESYFSHPKTALLFTPYILFSLLAMGLVRNKNAAEKDYIPGFQKIGIILSFTALILFLGGGLAFFFYVPLTAGAENLSVVLKKGAAPLVPLLIAVIRFLFAPKHYKTNEETGTTGSLGKDMTIPDKPVEATGILADLLRWIPAGFLVLLLTAGVCLCVWFLMKYLLARTPAAKKEKTRRVSFYAWMEALKKLVGLFWKKGALLIRGHESAQELYVSLLAWGRHSGVSRRPVETPREYGRRLTGAFPLLKREISLIVELFNAEVYGEKMLNVTELKEGSKAWKQLKHPAHFPMRIKTWFLSPGP